MIKSVQIHKHMWDLQQVICKTFEVPTLSPMSEENGRHVNMVCALPAGKNSIGAGLCWFFQQGFRRTTINI